MFLPVTRHGLVLLLLTRQPRRAVATLLVGYGSDDAPRLAAASLAGQPAPHQHPQRTAHLLRRHLRIFPPAASPTDSPRTTSPPDTDSCVSSTRCSCAPRSA